MSLKRRASDKILNFDLPVSYRVNETRMRYRDALNIFSNQGKGETRHGRSRVNLAALPGAVLSSTFFKHSNGNKYLLVKVGTEMYSIDSSGAATLVKEGLSAGTRHRGLPVARGSSSRHLVAIESDGLFQFDGVNFTQIGQEPPVAPTVATTPGAVANGTYRVALTFYSSATGFETNAGPLSPTVTTANQGIRVSGIPAVADNKTIDKVRIYLKNNASIDDPIFAAEIPLGTVTHDLIETPNSVSTPPIGHSVPLEGGGKYLLNFNGKLVVLGNSIFRDDALFSEPYIPDAFNDGTAPGRQVLFIPGDGDVTGGAIGLYNDSVLDPFIVIFKKRSTHIYSEINGEGKFATIHDKIGCVSHDTIQVIDGSVYFLSDQGWRVIRNGRFVADEKGNPITLGMGDIDDIFKSPGFTYEVNRSRMNDSFSVYYSALDQYITWVAEGARNDFSKAYVYEFNTQGFKPYEFASSATCACIGEDSEGDEVVYMGDADGFIYKHSIKEERQDEVAVGDPKDIISFGQLIWITGNDMDATHRFRKFLIRRLVGGGDLTLKVWVNYSMDNERTFTIQGPQEGFILDFSRLDIDSFGVSDRSIVSSMIDVNCTCESILFGFYQTGKGKNVGLVSAQIDYSKNRVRSL